MSRRAMHGQPRHVQRADLRPGLQCAALAPLLFRDLHVALAALLLLAFFESDLLIRVAHALALVRLRRPDVADFRSRLADPLAIGAPDQDLGLTRGLDRNPLGYRETHRVREAQRQVQRLAGHRGAEADAHELELAL